MSFEFADKVVIDALTPYVKELLECLSRALRQPGIAEAWVSDESHITHFLNPETTLEVLAQVSKELGVSVTADDYIYEIAIRMKGK